VIYLYIFKASRLGTLEEVEELFPGFKAFLDATEQEIPRPGNKAKRRSPGRGKRGVKAKELTCEEKAYNLALSKERVVVEHTISRLKKYRVMAQVFRNHLRHYDTVTDIVCGLVNLRILGTLRPHIKRCKRRSK
jgi:hypothetical protein